MRFGPTHPFFFPCSRAAMAAAFVGKHTEGAEFTVQSIPSAEDDDVYRASLAAHLLDAAVVELVPSPPNIFRYRDSAIL
jgi:hypothetical protein